MHAGTRIDIPFIDLDERRGVVSIDGRPIKELRPGYRPWRAFVVLARADGSPVEREELRRALGTNPERQDVEDVVRDVVRHLRRVLKRAGYNAKDLLETLGLGRWRVNARIRMHETTIETAENYHDEATDFRSALRENELSSEKPTEPLSQEK